MLHVTRLSDVSVDGASFSMCLIKWRVDGPAGGGAVILITLL